MSDAIVNQLRDYDKQLSHLMNQLNVEEKAAQIQSLQDQSAAPDFWDNPTHAQKLMQQMSHLMSQVDPWTKLNKRIQDAIELSEFGDEMADELATEQADIGKELEKMATLAMLSGEYDSEDAIVTIHSGAGGVDAQDWAEMLERMYLRWMEQNGYKAEILERSDGRRHCGDHPARSRTHSLG